MQNPHNNAGRIPLEEIQIFVEVAVAGSFTAAAERLNLSHSSLSRKVAYLEDWLGMRLFERRAHGVQLTQEGVGYFLQFRDGLDIVNGALSKQPRQASTNIVHVALFNNFATAWLFPKHRMLLARTGGVRPRYIFDRRPTDFADGTDLAMRYGMGDWPKTRAVRIAREDLVPVGNAVVVSEIGLDAQPEALLDFPLIHLIGEGAWRSWFSSHGIAYRQRPHDYVFEDQLLVTAATENGVGIALSRIGVQGAIAEGRLFALSQHMIPGDAAYYLVRPVGRPLSPAAKIYAREVLREAGVAEAERSAFIND
ncbi:MAG: LysR family transcriptional regulator [Proteobacteria bacterium]|nr:LysR family transcriptional regulator [Pseudomonadota bacterium]